MKRYVILALFGTFVIATVVIITRTSIPTPQKSLGPGVCSAHTCGALDPVSDPAYNLKTVIKQSLLLEEHLAEDRKYCKDCVCKHFLHIIALVEEAMMLAGKDMDAYPMLDQSLAFYESVYASWSMNKDSVAERRKALSLLRDQRKDLMRHYLL